jgi:hypothetical protein
MHRPEQGGAGYSVCWVPTSSCKSCFLSPSKNGLLDCRARQGISGRAKPPFSGSIGLTSTAERWLKQLLQPLVDIGIVIIACFPRYFDDLAVMERRNATQHEARIERLVNVKAWTVCASSSLVQRHSVATTATAGLTAKDPVLLDRSADSSPSRVKDIGVNYMWSFPFSDQLLMARL